MEGRSWPAGLVFATCGLGYVAYHTLEIENPCLLHFFILVLDSVWSRTDSQCLFIEIITNSRSRLKMSVIWLALFPSKCSDLNPVSYFSVYLYSVMPHTYYFTASKGM